MWEILHGLQFQSLSFCLGIIVGCIGVLAFSRGWKWMQSKRDSIKVDSQLRRGDALLSDIIRLNNDTLLRGQSWHISNVLFSLDEIILEPRLISPPIAPYSNLSNVSTDVTDWVFPYLPDWPDVASTFNAPTLSIPEALLGGCHLAITGHPGMGKSVALAYLAIQLIRNTTGIEELKNKVPILLHVADFLAHPGESIDVLAPIMQAISSFASPDTVKVLAKLLPRLFEDGRVILLFDGLDEIPPALFDPQVVYLSRLLNTYPQIRLVVTTSVEYCGGLLKLGLFPLAMASWSMAKKREFIQRWSAAWVIHIAAAEPEIKQSADPLLLHGWLANEMVPHTTLELTLRIWAALAGDSLGARPQDAVEAYIRRMTAILPERARLAVEQMALQMVRYMQPITRREDAETWLAGSLSAPSDSTQDLSFEYLSEEKDDRAAKDRAKAPGALGGLIESGIVQRQTGNRISFCHPLIAGYLAGACLVRYGEGAQLVLQPDWSGKFLALKQFCSNQDRLDFIDGLIQKADTDILMRNLFQAARWVSEAPETASWTAGVLRQLAVCLQKDNLPFNLKARALAALVASGKPSVLILFRQMLASPKSDLRQLALLGCGMIRDQSSINQMIALINDGSPQVRIAALLALVAIGNKACLEAVAEAILQGDELLRKAAAEALSNHPEEGHPALQEGSAHSDPLVRRAAVFGLKRVKQEWAVDILSKMRAEDTQWIVQDAAIQALVEIGQRDPHIPVPLPEITQAHWMIEFAAEENMSVPAGKAAIDLMHRSIKKGSEGQALSSIYYLGFKGADESLPILFSVLFNSRGEIRETTFNSLFYLAASGIPLPAPSYFGLG